MDEFNLEKSIKRKRLVYRISIGYILEIILDIMLSMTFLIMTVMLFINEPGQIVLKIIFTIMTMWILSGLWFMERLVPIQGKDIDSDRNLIISFFNKIPKLSMTYNDEKMVIYEKGRGLFNWGKSIVIIFNEKTIYINWSTLGRHDLKSPFHALSNYCKLLEIKKEIEKNGS